MTGDNVRPLPGVALPVPDPDAESAWVDEFIQDRVPEARGTLDAMEAAATEAEFIEHLHDLKAMVAGWPEEPT